jgi:hypothetical protein
MTTADDKILTKVVEVKKSSSSELKYTLIEYNNFYSLHSGHGDRYRW